MLPIRATRRVGLGFLAAVVVSGCGGGGTTNPSPPPPPAPVATTVEVSPASAPLFITDTLQLTATVRDQNGAIMTGKTVAWGSSSQALATVSSTGLVIGVGAGSVTISALMDGKTGTAVLAVTDPGPRISTEAATAASATIGVEGGSITATSTAGVTYTFIVPVGALAAPTLIRMTPVTMVRKLPLSGGLVGGVEFQPSGLRFARPARLRMAILQRPAAGMHVLGLVSDDGTTLLPEPALDSGTVASVPVLHFSSAVVGFGTTTDVNTLLVNLGGASTASQFYTDKLLGFAAAGLLNTPAAVQVLRDWFANVILPGLQHATTDAELVAAVAEFNWWNLDAPLALGQISPSQDPATYAAELGQFRPEAALKIGAAIDGNNVTCANQQSLIALGNVLFWQTQAEALGVATAAFNLDRASVLQALCVKVVLESGVLPNPMDLGTPYSLDATFGLQFLQNSSPQGEPFDMTLSATGLTLAHPTGASNLQGFYTTVATPTLIGAVSVSARACLILPGSSATSDVCGTGVVQSQAVGPLTITTTGLANGTVGASYAQTLQATGGPGSYAWSLLVGALPPGLFLNSQTGAITGTPQTNGVFGFTARVASGSSTKSHALSITVAPAQRFDFTFDLDAEGWTLGGLGGSCCAGNWGKSTWLLDVGAMDGKGVIQMDGTGDPGNPNAWITKSFTLPSNITTLQFDVWGHNRDGADARFIVRIFDGAFHTLDDEIIVGGPDNVLQIFTRQLDISAWAGRSVTIWFEQDDNGFMGHLPGGHEQIVLDNIHIRP